MMTVVCESCYSLGFNRGDKWLGFGSLHLVDDVCMDALAGHHQAAGS